LQSSAPLESSAHCLRVRDPRSLGEEEKKKKKGGRSRRLETQYFDPVVGSVTQSDEEVLEQSSERPGMLARAHCCLGESVSQGGVAGE
jgi:hypothetical protein